MKRENVLVIFIVSTILLHGCTFVENVLDSFLKEEKKAETENKTITTPSTTTPSTKTEVFCSYFQYFKAGPQDFDQWWIHSKDPTVIQGPEEWRRDIWVGRAEDYPYIGIYNNVDEREVMRWHIRLAKAAGISGFLLYVYNWETELPQTELFLEIAQQEDFKIGFVEHHSYLGARSIRVLDGRRQPLLPQKYVGYHQIMERFSKERAIPLPLTYSRYIRPKPRSLRDVPADALNQAADRISGMLNQWKAHPAYLRVDGKPIIVIPYMVEELTAGDFKQLVDMIKSNVGEDLYVVAIVSEVYWYFYPQAVTSTGITQEWADTGTNAFTHWTPNGMISASHKTRQSATRFHVKDSSKWKKDAMIPIMPGFEDDAWRPGDDPAPTSPRNNGQAWRDQLDAALAAKPRFIFIQGWNEWHEASQIEPSTHYSDPYLYLSILSQKLRKSWQTPPLPPENSVDSLRLPYLPY